LDNDNKVIKKKILVVAYVFPPISYAGAYRSLRLCGNLDREKFDITVLTIKEQADLENDPALLEKLDGSVKIHRTNTVDIWRSYQKLKPFLLKYRIGLYANKIVGKLIYLLNQPDHMLYWIPFAVFNGYRIIKNNRIDIVYVSSPPHSSQMIGCILKRLTGVKWVVDLRDPISDNVIANQMKYLEKKASRVLENIVVKYSDAVIANTFIAAKTLKEKYPLLKVFTVHNSFDENDFTAISKDKFDIFTIAHIGSIYHSRRVDGILKAIEELKKSGNILPNTFRLYFVGMNNEVVKEEAERFGISDYIETKGMVPHSEAIQIMAKSHLLLLIKGFGKHSDSQIPGKLFEYMATRNTVVGIGPATSEAAEIVHRSNAGHWTDGNTEDLKSIFMGYYTRYLQGRIARQDYLEQELNGFTSRSMTGKIASVLESV
jgi:glycosyltransferase involved in cell wall biosynthesis